MRTIKSKVSGTSFLSLLLMLACCGLLVGKSADPDCAGSSRLECIYASLGGQRLVIREVELPMAATAWTHRATQKTNSLHDLTIRGAATAASAPPDVWALEAVRIADDEREYESTEPAAANLIAMLKLPRTKPLVSAPSPQAAPNVRKIALVPPEAEVPRAFDDDVQSPKKKKKKKAKRKRVKPPDGEVAFSVAKEIPPRRNFSRQDAERLNNAAWTPDW